MGGRGVRWEKAAVVLRTLSLARFWALETLRSLQDIMGGRLCCVLSLM